MMPESNRWKESTSHAHLIPVFTLLKNSCGIPKFANSGLFHSYQSYQNKTCFAKDIKVLNECKLLKGQFTPQWQILIRLLSFLSSHWDYATKTVELQKAHKDIIISLLCNCTWISFIKNRNTTIQQKSYFEKKNTLKKLLLGILCIFICEIF